MRHASATLPSAPMTKPPVERLSCAAFPSPFHCPPPAEALAPHGEAIGIRRDADRTIRRIGHDRRRRGANVAEGCTQAVDRGIAREAAVVDQDTLGRRMDLAGELIECSACFRLGKIEHRVVNGAATRALQTCACRDLIGSDADACEARQVAHQRQINVVGVIGQCRIQEGEVRRDLIKGAVDATGRIDDGVSGRWRISPCPASTLTVPPLTVAVPVAMILSACPAALASTS